MSASLRSRPNCCVAAIRRLPKIKISPGCRGAFRVKMWGTSSPDNKLTGDLSNVIESIKIGGRRSDRLMAGELSPSNFGLLRHYRGYCGNRPVRGACGAFDAASIVFKFPIPQQLIGKLRGDKQCTNVHACLQVQSSHRGLALMLHAFADKYLLAEVKLPKLLERSGHSEFNDDGRNDIRCRVRRAGSCLRLLRSGLPVLACSGLTALVSVVATQSASAQASPPTLTEIVPASGRAGPAYPLPVTIRGTGFMPAGNVVRFGPVTLPAVSSPDGSRIMFYAPKAMPSRGEVPPAGLTPGDYPVTVTNSAGTSNALSFRLTHGP